MTASRPGPSWTSSSSRSTWRASIPRTRSSSGWPGPSSMPSRMRLIVPETEETVALETLVDRLLHQPGDLWRRLDHLAEVLPGHGDRPDRRRGDHGGGSGVAAEQGDLAEEVAGPDVAEVLAAAHDRRAALLDDEELVGGVALVQQGVALLDDDRVAVLGDLIPLAIRQPGEQGQRLEARSVYGHRSLNPPASTKLRPGAAARGAAPRGSAPPPRHPRLRTDGPATRFPRGARGSPGAPLPRPRPRPRRCRARARSCRRRRG